MEASPTPARKLSDRPEYQWAMLVVGWLLVISAPLAGILPGPGGVFIFAIGLAVILKHSRWAKKRFAAFSRANPEYGEWINWAMRRNKGRGQPDFPPIWRDLMHICRRDDIGQEMP